jgi:hypothetical protein
MSNDQLQLIIHTHGRRNDQLTIQWLPKSWLQRTTLVCPSKEYNFLRSLRDDYNVVVQPDDEWRLPKKREWIIQKWFADGYTKIVLLDDDLRFATRVSDDDWHLRELKGDELGQEFQRLEDKLGPEFPHAGFGLRQGNNTIEGVGWKIPGKQVFTLGYYLPIVAKEVRWDMVLLRSDYCATLQLLLKGYPNAIWTGTTADQRAFDDPGGCSRYRTVEMLDEEARLFQSLFPNYVSITERKYNESIKGGKKKKVTTRLELIVQWKKAWEDGINARNRSEQCT